MILVKFVLVLMILNCVRTTEHVEEYEVANKSPELDHKYSFWPSVHNAIRKRQAVQASVRSEGGGSVAVKALPMNGTLPTPGNNTEDKVQDKPVSGNNKKVITTSTLPQASPQAPPQAPPQMPPQASQPTVKVTSNSSADDPNPTPKPLEMSPAVMKRASIVFVGFLVLAGAYYVFYRKNNTKSDSNNSGANDTVQFRYGVLQSDERRDNLELSQIPLTMESDDDDDEDLEIFDLGQKKKSLSYVNLQPNDEDIVFNSTSREIDTDNLLLDIEDSNGSETLINWSSNGNKSIL